MARFVRFDLFLKVGMNLGKLRITLLMSLMALTSTAWACPLCASATPFKDGLLIAVSFLMLVPFIVTYLLYSWVQKATPQENQ